MRLVVFGGRNYDDRVYAFRILDRFNERMGPVTLLIHGDAEGADRLGRDWAIERGIEHAAYPAAWNDIDAPDAVVRHRRGDGTPYNALAGFKRNQRMLDEGKPSYAIGFPGGNGTRDMLRRCREARDRGLLTDVFEIKGRNPSPPQRK